MTLRQAIRIARAHGGDCYLLHTVCGWQVQPSHYPHATARLYVSAAGSVRRV